MNDNNKNVPCYIDFDNWFYNQYSAVLYSEHVLSNLYRVSNDAWIQAQKIQRDSDADLVDSYNVITEIDMDSLEIAIRNNLK